MLIINNLCVKYDTIRAVHDVSININDGELVSMIGANGAGKRTILKTISKIIKAESGSMFFNDSETKLK